MLDRIQLCTRATKKYVMKCSKEALDGCEVDDDVVK
jgi:hypothetical protein